MVNASLVRQILYPAPPWPVPSPPPAPLEERWLALRGGVRIAAWWLPPARTGSPRVLMLHGNGENLETMRMGGTFRQLEHLGVEVLAVDYPGYGRSEGRPSEEANIAAARAGLELLGGDGGQRAPVVLVGWSLGAAVAVQVATRRPQLLEGLVLMSAWSSLGEVARQHFPAWTVGLFLHEGYDSLAAAPLVRCPSLVVHGVEDELIAVEQGERLAAALPQPSRWVPVEGVGHNDLLAQPRVWRELAAFLDDPEQGGGAAVRGRADK